MSSFYQLHEIAKVEPYLLTKDLEKRIDAFITSWLDYCNSLFFMGLQHSPLHSLQLVQNAFYKSSAPLSFTVVDLCPNLKAQPLVIKIDLEEVKIIKESHSSTCGRIINGGF